MIHNHHRKRRPHCTEEEYDAPWNKLGLPDLMHVWMHDNVEKAYELGLLVHSYDDPKAIQVTIPEELLKTPRAKREKQLEKPRNRRIISLAVPKDEQEDGAGIFDELLKECKEVLNLATGGKSGDYNALVAVMYDWLRGQG